MEGFRQILPRDISLLVLTRWYAASNSPGCVNGQSEWTQFCRCVLSLMGYDVDRLPLTMQVTWLQFIILHMCPKLHRLV